MTDDRSSSVSQWGDAKRRGVVHSGGGIRNKSTTQAKHSEALNGQGELRTVHRTHSLPIPGRLQTHLGVSTFSTTTVSILWAILFSALPGSVTILSTSRM